LWFVVAFLTESAGEQTKISNLGYLPKGLGEMDSVSLAKVRHGEIEIFRPDEMTKLLEAAEPALIPFLTIGAFAGLRHAELQRLDWADMRLDDGFIEVKVGKAKTASRRLAPILDNLKRWLTPLRKAGGPICGYDHSKIYGNDVPGHNIQNMGGVVASATSPSSDAD
jgi:integrase